LELQKKKSRILKVGYWRSLPFFKSGTSRGWSRSVMWSAHWLGPFKSKDNSETINPGRNSSTANRCVARPLSMLN